MSFEEIVALLKSTLGEEIVEGIDENSTPKAIRIKAENLIKVMATLHSNERLYFDSLSLITGLDNGPEAQTMEVIYNLYSIPFNIHLMVKVTLDRNEPKLPSLTEIWKTADWQEREAFDLVGITFEGHPDPRRILMPSDWEGHPLQKDYKEQEYYHGIRLEE